MVLGICPGVFTSAGLPPVMVEIWASIGCIVGALVPGRLDLVDLTIAGLVNGVAGGLCVALMH